MNKASAEKIMQMYGEANLRLEFILSHFELTDQYIEFLKDAAYDKELAYLGKHIPDELKRLEADFEGFEYSADNVVQFKQPVMA